MKSEAKVKPVRGMALEAGKSMWNGPKTKESLGGWGVAPSVQCGWALRVRGRCEEARGRQGPGEEDHSSDFILKPWETTDGL